MSKVAIAVIVGGLLLIYFNRRKAMHTNEDPSLSNLMSELEAQETA